DDLEIRRRKIRSKIYIRILVPVIVVEVIQDRAIIKSRQEKRRGIHTRADDKVRLHLRVGLQCFIKGRHMSDERLETDERIVEGILEAAQAFDDFVVWRLFDGGR